MRAAEDAWRATVAVSAVVIHDDRLLMVRRKAEPASGRWSLPGGQVEAGEGLADALMREVQEETSAAVTPQELIGIAEETGGGSHFVILCYRARLADPAAQIAAGDDAELAVWVPLEEVLDLGLAGNLDKFLADHGIVPRRS